MSVTARMVWFGEVSAMRQKYEEPDVVVVVGDLAIVRLKSLTFLERPRCVYTELVG